MTLCLGSRVGRFRVHRIYMCSCPTGYVVGTDANSTWSAASKGLGQLECPGATNEESAVDGRVVAEGAGSERRRGIRQIVHAHPHG